jgi:hypothetical protein
MKASDARRSRERSPPPHADNEGPPAGDHRPSARRHRQGRRPKLKAMFETSAEVLAGLTKAFSDYERKNENASR